MSSNSPSEARPDPPHRRRIVVDGALEGFGDFEASLDQALDAAGYAAAERFAVRLALEEGVANAINHGNRGRTGRKVVVECGVDPEQVLVAIEDEGEGFDPAAVPDPTDEANLEIPSGRGLMLMRAYMTKVRHVPPGNRVEMIYRKGSRETAG
jgi:serine/threonine-protein kinase RsbW